MTILIQNLCFKTIIGLLDFERKTPQRVIINAEFYVDDEMMVLNYADVAEMIEKTFTCKEFETVEESLHVTLSIIKKKYPFIKKSKMQIIKPDILQNCEVGARLEKKY